MRFNDHYIDSVYIVANGDNWQVLMVDLLGRGQETHRGGNTSIQGILSDVSRHVPKHISIIY